MTKSFDTQFRELVLAVALCDLENIQRILSSEWYENNTVKIMGKGRNVGFIDIPITIHNIVQCWHIILDLNGVSKDFLLRYEGCFEKLHDNNLAIMDMLSHKFTGSHENIRFDQYTSCTPYGVMDEEDMNDYRSELEDCNLRPIDEDLALCLNACDLEKFEELVRYGANPWATLNDGTCVWKRIATWSSEMTDELLHKVLYHAKRYNLPELIEEIISVAVYTSFKNLLQRYVPYDSETKSSPIKTIPRIIYTSNDGMHRFFDTVEFELAYDKETGKTEYNNDQSVYSESQIVIQPKAIKSLLTQESIERFMNLELQPSDEFVLDGGTYTMKMIDANGNIKEVECDESEKKQVPQIVFLEKYAKSMRKEIQATFESM